MNFLPDGLAGAFPGRADIGHLALFLWALAASIAGALGLGAATEAARRAEAVLQDFLREIDRFNQRHGDD